MTLSGVPIIDIAPFRNGSAAERRAVATAVDEACRQIGFLVIAGHGVPASLIAETEAVSRQFFDLPLAEKMKVKAVRAGRDARLYPGAGGKRRSQPRRGGARRYQRVLHDRSDRPPATPYFTGPQAASISPPISGRPCRRRCGRCGPNITGDGWVGGRSCSLRRRARPGRADFFADKIAAISAAAVRNYPAPHAPAAPGSCAPARIPITQPDHR